MLYLGVIWWGWIIFECYLLWLNYRGRFRYALLEWNPWKRWLQAKIGVFSLFFSFLVDFLLILFLSALVQFVFSISAELAVGSIVSLFFGMTLSNAFFDKFSVEAFEKHCLKCDNKRECSAFLNEKCSMKYLKHRVKMAVQLNNENENLQEKRG